MFKNDRKQQAIDFILQFKDQLIAKFGEVNEHTIHAINVYVNFMYDMNQVDGLLTLLEQNHQNAINNLAQGHKEIVYSSDLLEKIKNN